MKLDVIASESQYLDSLAPIWCEIPEGLRGDFMVPDHLIPRARLRGVEAVGPHEPWSHVGLVASERDLRALHGKPAILCEHGAGQSYSNTHPAYAGGDGRDSVILFLCPGWHPAQRNQARYPDATVVEIGNPRLDTLRDIDVPSHPPTLAFAFHWGCEIAAEAGSAFGHWREHLDVLAEQWRLVGTGHPRAFSELTGFYETHGIIPVSHFDAIVAEADVLIADNTSVMCDFAALGRPVVTLNAPTWRKHVNHGVRFWDAIPGPQADHPADLVGAVDQADDAWARKARARTVASVYTHLEGAAKLAAEAIVDAMERVEVPRG